jgi:hypothetical protein
VIVATLILLLNDKAGMRPTRGEQEINQQIVEYDNQGHITHDISALFYLGDPHITRIVDYPVFPLIRH